MSWNYRVVSKDNFVQIHEVYYDKYGNKKMVSQEGISPAAETKEELEKELKKMKKAFDLPTLDYYDF